MGRIDRRCRGKFLIMAVRKQLKEVEPRANHERTPRNCRKTVENGNRWGTGWSGGEAVKESPLDLDFVCEIPDFDSLLDDIDLDFFFRFVRRFTIEQWANREKMTCWPLLNLARTQHETRQALHPKSEFLESLKGNSFPP